jgi:hypothetical protein
MTKSILEHFATLEKTTSEIGLESFGRRESETKIKLGKVTGGFLW